MELLTPTHPRWDEFCQRLEGPEGCRVRLRDPDDPNSLHWRCEGGNSLRLSQMILARMGLRPPAIKATLEYYRGHGGYCDCEVLMNVARKSSRLGRMVTEAQGLEDDDFEELN